MQKIATLFYKLIRRIIFILVDIINSLITYVILYCNNVHFKKIYTNGIPFVSIARSGKCTIGNNFIMNNNIRGNPIGRVEKCILAVGSKGKLTIGNNVGISSTSIVAEHDVYIGDNVKIGGGVCIYDTDFHSVNFKIRKDPKMDYELRKIGAVVIKNNVFIGAHSTLLKGITIGKNSVVGACSVVTKDIPDNEIWAGNPARFINKLELINE